MTEQLCPACGCSIEGEAYEQDGLKYCCEPCAASDGPCQCGCCQSAEDANED